MPAKKANNKNDDDAKYDDVNYKSDKKIKPRASAYQKDTALVSYLEESNNADIQSVGYDALEESDEGEDSPQVSDEESGPEYTPEIKAKPKKSVSENDYGEDGEEAEDQDEDEDDDENEYGDDHEDIEESEDDDKKKKSKSVETDEEGEPRKEMKIKNVVRKERLDLHGDDYKVFKRINHDKIMEWACLYDHDQLVKLNDYMKQKKMDIFDIMPEKTHPTLKMMLHALFSPKETAYAMAIETSLKTKGLSEILCLLSGLSGKTKEKIKTKYIKLYETNLEERLISEFPDIAIIIEKIMEETTYTRTINKEDLDAEIERFKEIISFGKLGQILSYMMGFVSSSYTNLCFKYYRKNGITPIDQIKLRVLDRKFQALIDFIHKSSYSRSFFLCEIIDEITKAEGKSYLLPLLLVLSERKLVAKAVAISSTLRDPIDGNRIAQNYDPEVGQYVKYIIQYYQDA